MDAAFDYLAFFSAALAGYLAIYLLTNGVCTWVYSSGLWDWSRCRIQTDRTARAGQVWREIQLSVLNLPFFALSATIAYGLYRQGWTLIYLELANRSWLYFAFTVLLVMGIHETKTKEFSLLETSTTLHGAKRRAYIEEAKKDDARAVFDPKEQDLRIWFHQNGVPQVIAMDRTVFAGEPVGGILSSPYMLNRQNVD